ncbi:hypothetical protein N39L_13610 [Limnospira platensis NIES-39]|nr:hypothetical protein N39L_13610 [Arthrospira platensis NIES-39]
MKKAGIGIPTIQDRARQALVKSALEPEWESRFEGTSYGFRPGRSAQDAIARIYLCIALVKVVRTQLGERSPWHHRENQTAHVQWRMRAFNHDQHFSILLRSGE